MNHFDERPLYKVGRHAIRRWYERAGCYNKPELNVIGNLIYCLNKAQLLFQYKKVRVMRYLDLVFPCAKLGAENDFDWKVTTVLTWDMVQHKPQMLNALYRPEVQRQLKAREKLRVKAKKAKRKAGLQ